MQSWGTDSHFDIRHTDQYPSKSAVLGLVAAALGWRRDDKRIESLNGFRFAVRIDQPGNIMKDYQTVHKAEVSKGTISYKTYITSRYYIEDAVFVVALGHEDKLFADSVAEALQKPYFQLFMGRRSLPLPIDFVLAVRDEDVIAALRSIPWQAAGWYKWKQNTEDGSKRLSVYAEAFLQNGIERIRKDQVVSLSHRGRRYVDRIETESAMLIEADGGVRKEHDAFSALRGV